ncbi:MAG: hypothetical protein RLZZ417_65 [Bacteroidota bacterium]|jgi:hypothetical protein
MGIIVLEEELNFSYNLEYSIDIIFFLSFTIFQVQVIFYPIHLALQFHI